MSGFSNFAISFTIISILSGTLTLYYTGINYGGPVQEAYGWPLVSVFVIVVGLGMAEIASRYPTAGGLYYWASKMGGAGWGWFTGWFNLIGQIAITAGIDYGAAVFADALLQLLWPGTFHGTQHEVVAVYGVILIVHALMNIMISFICIPGFRGTPRSRKPLVQAVRARSVNPDQPRHDRGCGHCGHGPQTPKPASSSFCAARPRPSFVNPA
jgi:amino acid transporter